MTTHFVCLAVLAMPFPLEGKRKPFEHCLAELSVTYLDNCHQAVLKKYYFFLYTGTGYPLQSRYSEKLMSNIVS